MFPSKTALNSLHKKHQAKLVDFASYEMPLHYESGMVKEHLHTRNKAGLFDVSHMGQILVSAPNMNSANILKHLEKVSPSPLQHLKIGQCKYTVLLNDRGGCVDDLIIQTIEKNKVLLVVNASNVAKDLDYLHKQLPFLVFNLLDDHSLVALQGPEASYILEQFLPGVNLLPFMHGGFFSWNPTADKKPIINLWVSRTGYTGEDGFEISIPNDHAPLFVKFLLEKEPVKLIGLGARDSLRLEAGLSLYSHEIDEENSFLESGLHWIRGSKKDTPFEGCGADVLNTQIHQGVKKSIVGLKVFGKSIARQGMEVFSAPKEKIGVITSGTFSPTMQTPIALARVDISNNNSKPGKKLYVQIRSNFLEAEVIKLPFVPHRYIKNIN